MKRLPFCRLSVLVAACVVVLWGRSAPAAESSIARVEQMPDLPRPFQMRDWRQVTQDYLDFVLDFEHRGKHLPLVAWRDENRTMVTLPSYVGSSHGAPEGINFMGAVVSGGLVDLDMRRYRGQNWVAMCGNYFNAADGAFSNGVGAGTGASFWYDLFSTVLFFQICDLFPDDPERDKMLLSTARKWYEASIAMGASTDPPKLPNFDHTAFSLAKMAPVDNGRWIEPDGAAAVAWIEYMAWRKFKDPRFLTAANWAIRALEKKPVEKNPLYEVLLPYGALVAARMNVELGCDYDVPKLVNWCFTARGAPQARPYWGVIADRWYNMDAHGLVGSTTDGGGYAFAMNTFQWAGALTPLARYDCRYAHDVGKWMLNLANAARLFYSNAHDPEHQTGYAWASKYDLKSVIAYEGLRKGKRGAATARADYRTHQGMIVSGSYVSTQYYKDQPPNVEVLKEAPSGGTMRLEHIWTFDLPPSMSRWLVVAAKPVDEEHTDVVFRFSYAAKPEGPYARAFTVEAKTERPAYAGELPDAIQGKLYVKVESDGRPAAETRPAQLRVDALAISYQAPGPFAQGDAVVSFIDLIHDFTLPIVLYRPSTTVTDFALYGGSHVGYLGGLVQATNVPDILQLDLLKTDFYHAAAYPTYLYYNPHESPKTVMVDVGKGTKNVYDSVTHTFLQQNVDGQTEVQIPPDSARVLVIVPAGGKMRYDGNHTLIDNVVVDYGHKE